MPRIIIKKQGITRSQLERQHWPTKRISSPFLCLPPNFRAFVQSLWSYANVFWKLRLRTTHKRCTIDFIIRKWQAATRTMNIFWNKSVNSSDINRGFWTSRNGQQEWAWRDSIKQMLWKSLSWWYFLNIQLLLLIRRDSMFHVFDL